MAAVWLGKSYPRLKACEQALISLIDVLGQNSNGKVKVTTFIKFLLDYDIHIHAEEVEELKKIANDDGEVATFPLKTFVRKSWFWDEFQQHAETMYSDYRRENEDNQAVNIAFKAFDKNKDSMVSKSEFKSTLTKLKQDQIDAVSRKFDEDNDGKLSLDEFKNFMNARKFRKSS